MNPALPTILLLSSTQLAGVVTLPRGVVTAGDTPATAGTVLSEGSVVRTGADGWAEIHLRDDTRVRVSARTQIAIEGGITLQAGRLWIEVPKLASQVAIRCGGVEVTASPEASVVIDRDARTGTFVAVDRGTAEVSAGMETVEVKSGFVAHVPRGTAELEARSGGEATTDLAAAEARSRRGDLIGVEAFLVSWARRVKVGEMQTRGSREVLALDAEIAGSDAGAAGLLLEGARRPPPFFEEEVPPKGPNVQVEVRFGGD